jgi:hypothetical protein
MARQLYSPIVKGKLNDLKALGKISGAARAQIKPLIEAMPLPKDGDIDRHLHKLAHYLMKHVPLGEIYLDFYGLLPGQKTPDGTDATIAGFNLVRALGRTVTPVYGFDRDDSLWPLLVPVIQSNAQGFCFRVDVDDLDDLAEETWGQILERSAELGLRSNQIDLLLDLRDVMKFELDELQRIVEDFFGINPDIRGFRSVILAGSSALKTVADIPKDGVGHVTRRELLLWSRVQREVSRELPLVFGDYGVIHPDFSDQGPNNYMNAKIRYTDRGRIVYFRGHGLKHPVKDYVQYHSLAAQVRDSGAYQGREFSYGDWYIDTVADFNTTSGHPGTWVLADMNHHLEYTTMQMSKLVSKVLQVADEAELEEMT